MAHFFAKRSEMKKSGRRPYKINNSNITTSHFYNTMLLLFPFQKGICFCFKSHDYYYAECNKTVNSVKRSWRNYMARKATLLSWECKIQQTVTVFLEISGVCFHAFNVLIVFSGVTMSSYSHLLGHTIFRTHIVVIFFWGNVNTFGHKCISEWEKGDSFSPLLFWLVCIWAEMMWIWSRYLTKRNIFFLRKSSKECVESNWLFATNCPIIKKY